MVGYSKISTTIKSGKKKMFILQRVGQYFHNLLYIFIYKKVKISLKVPNFPSSTIELFPGRKFPNSPFFPTMTSTRVEGQLG